MNKIFCLLFSILIIFTITGCNNIDDKYPDGGRDTVAQFGDRRFVVLSGKNGSNVEWILYDRENINTIDNIEYYKEKKDFVYTVGLKGYTKLNFKTGKYTQTNDLSEYSQEDQSIFKDLENNKPNKK